MKFKEHKTYADKQNIQKLWERVTTGLNNSEKVAATIQTRDETIEATCIAITTYTSGVHRVTILLRANEVTNKDIRDIYLDRNCYAYIDKEPQIVFKFPEPPEGTPLEYCTDREVVECGPFEFEVELQ